MDRAPAAALPKQKRLSIEEKLSICKRYSKKVSVKVLAADFRLIVKRLSMSSRTESNTKLLPKEGFLAFASR